VSFDNFNNSNFACFGNNVDFNDNNNDKNIVHQNYTSNAVVNILESSSCHVMSGILSKDRSGPLN
jgi:hypothetical protein